MGIFSMRSTPMPVTAAMRTKGDDCSEMHTLTWAECASDARPHSMSRSRAFETKRAW